MDEGLLCARSIEVVFDLTSVAGRKRVVALSDVSVCLQEGVSVAVIGESGSGKTTLGMVMAGLLLPQKGNVLFDGADVYGSHDKGFLRRFRRAVQLVFQNPTEAVDPLYTIREYFYEALDVHFPNLKKDEKLSRARLALKDVGLEDVALEKFPAELSGGQLQRVCIARAIMLSPKVLILDEPTSALDKDTERMIVSLIMNLKKKYGFSMMFISHDLALAEIMADNILLLKNGKVVESGPANEFFRSPSSEYGMALLSSIL